MKRDVWMFVALALLLAWCGRDGARLHGQTLVDPNQLKAPRVSVLSCTGDTSPTSNCTGEYYVDVITPAGTELKIVGGLAPGNIVLDPKLWSTVP